MVNQYPLPRHKRETPELVGNGGAVYGPFSFKIFDVEDVVVEVKRKGSIWAREGVSVAKVGGAAFDHFTITFDEVIGADVSFRVKGKRLHERLSELTRGGTIIVDEMEKEASKQGVVLQELRRDMEELPALRDEVGAALDVVQAQALEAALHAGSAEQARDEAQAAKQAAEAAAALATAIADFNPSLYLEKAGGVMSGHLTVEGNIQASNIYNKQQIDDKFLFNDEQFLSVGGGELTGELISRSQNALRLTTDDPSTIGVILRNDGENLYILLTNAGDRDGMWNNLRPLRINLTTGMVFIEGTLQVSGNIKCSGNIEAFKS